MNLGGFMAMAFALTAGIDAGTGQGVTRQVERDQIKDLRMVGGRLDGRANAAHFYGRERTSQAKARKRRRRSSR